MFPHKYDQVDDSISKLPDSLPGLLELHETEHCFASNIQGKEMIAEKNWDRQKSSPNLRVSLDCPCTISNLNQIEVHSPFRGDLIKLWNLSENVWHNTVLNSFYWVSNLMVFFWKLQAKLKWNKKLPIFQWSFGGGGKRVMRFISHSLFKIKKAAAFHLSYMSL